MPGRMAIAISTCIQHGQEINQLSPTMAYVYNSVYIYQAKNDPVSRIASKLLPRRVLQFQTTGPLGAGVRVFVQASRDVEFLPGPTLTLYRYKRRLVKRVNETINHRFWLMGGLRIYYVPNAREAWGPGWEESRAVLVKAQNKELIHWDGKGKMEIYVPNSRVVCGMLPDL
ncbi:hypothetical protein CAPTEDRAFT_191986 [Capitella teleta]|uniref:Uncharacterized protein n=1 Tax=Capitella teleta TaxID=283909 RepID=R7TGA9_CAPTE|nr:hypothetical protein CAPTEDRAFT_191986 [Capitella teleta]|eukprot:ELT90601.1 hypothetical protein CAPTEDRAFT_191986 [Capitella teleta]